MRVKSAESKVKFFSSFHLKKHFFQLSVAPCQENPCDLASLEPPSSGGWREVTKHSKHSVKQLLCKNVKEHSCDKPQKSV